MYKIVAILVDMLLRAAYFLLSIFRNRLSSIESVHFSPPLFSSLLIVLSFWCCLLPFHFIQKWLKYSKNRKLYSCLFLIIPTTKHKKDYDEPIKTTTEFIPNGFLYLKQLFHIYWHLNNNIKNKVKLLRKAPVICQQKFV